MKLKNILLTGLSMVLVAAIAISGTVAYLTSEDSDVNVMTLGNVKIKQHEYERVLNADGTYEMVTSEKYGEGYKLQEFTQAKPLYPATGEITGWGTIVPFDQIEGASGAQAVFAGLNNVQDKFVLVENTGKTDAYVRTLIALEYGSNTKDIIGISTGDFWTWNAIGIVNIDNNNYYLYEAIYNGSSSRHVGGILPAGEYTYSSLNQIYLANEATNEDCEALDGNKNGTYDILVFSQAVQTAGFSDATTALDAAFGDITTTNHPWVKGAKIPTTVSNADDLVAALEADGDVVMNGSVTVDADTSAAHSAYGDTGITVDGDVFDGAGNTLTVNNSNLTWDSAVYMKSGTFKNATVNGAFRGIFMGESNGDVYIDNVVLDNVCYTFNSDGGSKDYGVYISNTTLNGWTSYSDVHKEVVFTNCTFGEDTGGYKYAFCRPYNASVFENCVFEEGFEFDTSKTSDLTFINCYYGETLITAENAANLEIFYNGLNGATIK